MSAHARLASSNYRLIAVINWRVRSECLFSLITPKANSVEHDPFTLGCGGQRALGSDFSSSLQRMPDREWAGVVSGNRGESIILKKLSREDQTRLVGKALSDTIGRFFYIQFLFGTIMKIRIKYLFFIPEIQFIETYKVQRNPHFSNEYRVTD